MASMDSMAGMMGNMGGMDMSSDGMFRPYNQWLAAVYWYIIVAVIGFCLLLHGLHIFNARLRIWQLHTHSVSQPARPHNWASQFLATCTALVRESSYPQVFAISKTGLSWMTPPSLGRMWIILSYWVMITILLTYNAVMHDAYYWERIGFRAAWISVTQIPLVIILAGKVNVIGFLIGSSHERLNWLHRWVARTLFVSVTVHGAFFLAEWVRADFVSLELEMMPMVKYGMGSWCVLLWTNLTGLAPLRHMAYEFFVLQHLASAGILLWLLYNHVPSYAMYNVWIAIGFIAFDRVAYTLWFAYRNLTCQGAAAKSNPFAWRAGYRAEIEAKDGEVTIITIKDARFNWRPGQHLYLWIPRIGWIESHPFTISNAAPEPSGESATRDAQLAIRAHSGFSRRLYKKAQAAQPQIPTVMTAFIVGPFGAPPAWQTFETVLLISASTGASFTLPILESILCNPGCVAQLRFLWLVRQRQDCDCYLDRLKALASQAESLPRISARIEIAVSREFTDGGDVRDISECSCSYSPPADTEINPITAREKLEINQTSLVTNPEHVPLMQMGKEGDIAPPTCSASASEAYTRCKAPVHFSLRRANLQEFILTPVEKAFGETMVAVCGGKRLTSDVRNCVAKLSDDRAVHKGTGAQGICLYVEEFAF
ncbi:ferric reductase family protein [Aspergillus thermomutatus]|uniref:ferric-chelate reductase (NADPH) n=1 Tax=Aspergillus thermomutatus TaxID=41047 RepID=A0A397HTJ0_ASPTH|nr:uncharacterized protein CDV56_100145 [Aspergillus thermomutatus]RHZ64896.1 hypothetical protein CDV56_100145 [Aspergillus thermomutatus]